MNTEIKEGETKVEDQRRAKISEVKQGRMMAACSNRSTGREAESQG